MGLRSQPRVPLELTPAIPSGQERSKISPRESAGVPYALPVVVAETEERILLRARPHPGNFESRQIDLRYSRFSKARCSLT